MKKKEILILTANICSCKILEIPPVGRNELERIIRYKLSSCYPGAVDDLTFDYIKNGSLATVFYMNSAKLKSIKEKNPHDVLYSSYHLLSDVKNKEGVYVIPLNERLEIFRFKADSLIELRSIEDTEENREKRKESDNRFIERESCSVKKAQPLFSKRTKTNYPPQILLLVTLIIGIPQFSYYQQIRKDEKYLEILKNTTREMSVKSAEISASEQELNLLLTEYNSLLDKKPLNIYDFLSDLSFALGSDVQIETLILKGSSFQMNGRGINPLGKMEKFQKNIRFNAVLPYQVQAIEGSSLEKFSLTGFYDYE